MHLMDDPVLDADPTRIGTTEISQQLLESRWGLQGVGAQHSDDSFRLFPSSCLGEALCILLSLASVDYSPTHQSRSSEQFSSGSFIPAKMDSLIPGIAVRKRVSSTAFQSSSDTRTADPCLLAPDHGLSENLLLRLPHRVLTFTVPRLLRPHFRHNRTLFAELMQLIHRMIADF